MKDELMTCALWEKEKSDSRHVNKSLGDKNDRKFWLIAILYG